MHSIAPPTFAPGSMLGRYRLERRLGLGGMGEVYEAWHTDLNKRVAVKTLLPAIASRPEIRQRFVREGQATARLRHPHAVDVSDVGIDQDTPYLVMEFLDGETLESLIAREAPLATTRVAELMLPVIAAVKAAHDEGIVHRDLKPANIFLHRSRDNRTVPKVLDFGISKMADDDSASPLTQTASLLGTPHYMSPEQLRSSKYVDARSDQYALGAILYECATRQKAFQGETMFLLMSAIVNGQFAPPRALVPSIPPDFERLILRAMCTDPAQRFESLHALGCALLSFADPRARGQWESVFDGPTAPSSSPPSWVQNALSSSPSYPGAPSPSYPAAPDSLAGARNSVMPTPLPGTLAGTSLDVAQPSTPRPRLAAPILVGLAVLAVVAGVTVLAIQRLAPATPEVSHTAVAAPQAPPTAVAAPVAPAPRAAPAVRPTPVAPAALTATPERPADVEPSAPRRAGRGHGRGRRRGGDLTAPMFAVPSASTQSAGTNSIPIVQ